MICAQKEKQTDKQKITRLKMIDKSVVKIFMTHVINKAAHEHCVGRAWFDENRGSGEKG